MHGTKVENIPQLSTFDPEQKKIMVIVLPIYAYAEVTETHHELPRNHQDVLSQKM